MFIFFTHTHTHTYAHTGIEVSRPGVNSIPELELTVNSPHPPNILNGIDKFVIGIEVCYKFFFNPQINLSFHFFIQNYFFYDNPTWNINYLE